MNELALFAGHGGGVLGGKLLGWRTVCAVEYDDYARRVLMARQNDGCLEPFPIWDDVRTFDGKPWAGLVDVVSGGFPCQDISAAGSGAGIDGARSGLWGEMARIIREVGPRFVFVENSPMLTSRGLGRVVGDLASMGYDAAWGVLGAVHAGAPHRRERIWLVAYSAEHGRGAGRTGRPDTGSAGKPELALQAMADAGRLNGDRWPHIQDRAHWETPKRNKAANHAERCGEVGRPGEASGWWPEPDVGRVAHGVASRVDRLRGLGNGQVPAVAALAFQTLSARLMSALPNRELDSKNSA